MSEDLAKLIANQIDAMARDSIFTTATVATPANSVLTMDKLREAMKLIPQPVPPPIRVFASAYWPQVEAGAETVRFEAHPFIQWLARWLPITPYIEATYTQYRDADPLLDKARGVLYCSMAHERALREQLSGVA